MWLFWTKLALNKNIKTENKIEDTEFDNISRLFYVLPNFHFATSETMGDYYLQTWYIPLPSGVAERLKT